MGHGAGHAAASRSIRHAGQISASHITSLRHDPTTDNCSGSCCTPPYPTPAFSHDEIIHIHDANMYSGRDGELLRSYPLT
ncbi:hypothetical protein EYF80_007426 [Liparis tanakae]|uniref:Uncharacterized protein n=1 Tax=Liparis tanakae TaxID=230148 RepID=A0A4Z2IWG3_9TELE|nr:hypothetical protein EYF80_007426 [Liparis tanakae]